MCCFTLENTFQVIIVMKAAVLLDYETTKYQEEQQKQQLCF